MPTRFRASCGGGFGWRFGWRFGFDVGLGRRLGITARGWSGGGKSRTGSEKGLGATEGHPQQQGFANELTPTNLVLPEQFL